MQSAPVFMMLALTTIAALVLMVVQHRRLSTALEQAARHRAELTHALRLITVGELTASIAHEINQPLGAILSNAEAAEMLLNKPAPPMDELRQILADIRADDMRATAVIQQLRALLHKAELPLQTLVINEVATHCVALVRGAAGRGGVRVSLALGDDLPTVSGDRTQLQQAILNLLLNALDASQAALPEARHVVVRTCADRGGVSCVVLDQGHGMTAETQARAFESFYTTKPDGLGLGLAIVRTIAARHRGIVRLVNRPEGGVEARFTVPAEHVCQKEAA
ncbi:MAG: HAMP domain-containing sensor histidine kinase [Rhodocyclaceae bacterium]